MIKRSNRNSLQTDFEQISGKNTLRILFSDEKFFDIDGVYNSENEGMWAINRADTDGRGDVMQKQKFIERKPWYGWVPAPRVSHPWCSWMKELLIIVARSKSTFGSFKI